MSTPDPRIPTGPIDAEPSRDLAELYRRQDQQLQMPDTARALHDRENQALILAELESAGVELGDYDWRMIAWLAGWEYSTLVTVASWIRRAHATGKDAT